MPRRGLPDGFTNIGTVAEGSLRACRLPERIVGNLLVPERDGTVYAISGRVAVGDDQGGDINNEAAGAQEGVLTIEPGVTLYGSAGADLLVVNRGSQIYAQGTATKPITLTARADIEGQTNANSIGLWGGLVLLGRAPINACPGTTVSGTPECQATIEGTDGFYGGNAPRDNSGIVKYLRVKHSGFEVTPNNELNGITSVGRRRHGVRDGRCTTAPEGTNGRGRSKARHVVTAPTTASTDTGGMRAAVRIVIQRAAATA